MPYFGSFALLCALALGLYSLVVGAISLLRENPVSRRLSETARRAGIAGFLAVAAAAVGGLYVGSLLGIVLLLALLRH